MHAKLHMDTQNTKTITDQMKTTLNTFEMHTVLSQDPLANSLTVDYLIKKRFNLKSCCLVIPFLPSTAVNMKPTGIRTSGG